jgi:hypothetical protein
VRHEDKGPDIPRERAQRGGGAHYAASRCGDAKTSRAPFFLRVFVARAFVDEFILTVFLQKWDIDWVCCLQGQDIAGTPCRGTVLTAWRRGEAFAMMQPGLYVLGWQMLRPYRTVPISWGLI